MLCIFFIGVHFPAASRHSYFLLFHSVSVNLRDQAACFSVGTMCKVAGQKLTTRPDLARKSRML